MYNLVFDHTLKAPDGSIDGMLPNDWREISEKEFAQGQFRIFSRVKNIESRFNGTLFWFYDNTGVAIVTEYWQGKVKYYAFGCDHKYVELTPEECGLRSIEHFGRCYHVEECSNCKRISTRDSSD
jgi:hypothetical protein